MHVTIRQAQLADAPRLAQWAKAMAWETEHKQLADEDVFPGVRRAIEQAGLARYFIAELDGRYAGCLMLTYEWSDWRNKTFWWISSYYVKPELRGRGIYDAMDRKLQELAAQAGDVCGLRTYVHKSCKAFQDVCRHLGMAEKEYVVFEDMF